MPAKAPGKTPEKKDVKNETTTPSVAEASTEKPTQEVVKTEEGQDFTEEDLAEAQKERAIPYNRFKEVNEEKNSYKQKFEETANTAKRQLEDQAAIYEAKIQALQKQKESEDYSVDYGDSVYNEGKDELVKKIKHLEQTVDTLKNWREESSFQSEINSLKGQFPEADINAVLGWKKVFPKAEIKELMQRSHDDNNARVDSALRKIIEQKKQKAKGAIITNMGPTIKLKESERPKTIAEATKAAKEWFGNN